MAGKSERGGDRVRATAGHSPRRPDKIVTVTVDPLAWFIRPDGTVLDLSQFDFDATGQVVEFEVEMEDGFTEIEFDE